MFPQLIKDSHESARVLDGSRIRENLLKKTQTQLHSGLGRKLPQLLKEWKVTERMGPFSQNYAGKSRSLAPFKSFRQKAG